MTLTFGATCGCSYDAATRAEQSSLRPFVTPDVVIPTWNAADMLGRCLHALQEEPAAVIVVDNGSVDGTAERVWREFPGVVLVELPENVGFGRAVSAGVRAGVGEAVVLINNDVVV